MAENVAANKQQKTTMQITGMTCAACARRIEKGLQKTAGVQDATVNLSLERASVTFDPKKISVVDLGQRIESLGYGTVKEKAELLVTGMTCAACATRIEKGLKKLVSKC